MELDTTLPDNIVNEKQESVPQLSSDASLPRAPMASPIIAELSLTIEPISHPDAAVSVASTSTVGSTGHTMTPASSSTSVNYSKSRGRKAPADEHVCFKCREVDNKDDEEITQPKTPREIPWIFCDNCKNWYHLDCVGIEEYAANLVDKYHCHDCDVTVGPSIYKQVILDHRYNFDALNETNLPSQVGTKAWIADFVKREASFTECPKEIMNEYPSGESFREYFNQDTEWKNPVMINDVEGLKMKLPSQDFDMHKLYELVGPEESIDTIDVYMQLSSKMSFKSFYDRWMDAPRTRLYNMLSFEFSHTSLMDIVRAPELMYRLSWVHRFWPEEHVDYDDIISGTYQGVVAPDHINCRPDVAMFCLLGMGGSYTEFHIDFGGSSVWYHVFKGQKIFYVVEPTEENLSRFVEWTNSDNRSETWFGDCVPHDQIYRVVIDPGKTVMIPSGWIHAVYTPVDSMVFGGNFIHDLNIVRQLKVYEVEQLCNYDENFMFPQFELSNWYGAKVLTERLKNATDDWEELPSYVINGLKAYLKVLPIWHQRSPCHPHFKTLIRIIENGLKKYAKLCEKNSPKRKRLSGSVTKSPSDKAAPLKLRIKLNNRSVESPAPSPPSKNEKKNRDDKAIAKAMKLPKKDSQSLSSMFSGRSGSGRKIKVASWVQERAVSSSSAEADAPSTSKKGFFDSFDEEEKRNFKLADRIAERESRQLGDAAYESDDDDDELIQRAGKKRCLTSVKKATSTAKATPKAPPKPKKVETAKQRLAKKLKLRK